MSVELISWGWQQSWQVAVLALLVWAVTATACRRRPHLAYLLWIMVIVKALTPPIWSSPVGVFSLSTSRAAHLSSTQIPSRSGLSAGNGTERPADKMPLEAVDVSPPDTGAALVATPLTLYGQPTQAKQPVWPVVLGSFWAVGAVALFTTVVANWLRCYRQLSGIARKPDSETESLFNQLRVQLGVSRRVALMITSGSHGPVVVGVLRPRIFLPSGLLQGKDSNGIEPILAHELVHVRRGDPLIGVVQFVAQVLWWFHPMVWLANREANRCRERSCDEETVAGIDCRPGDYARALVYVLESKQQLRPAAMFPGVRSAEVTFKRLEHIMRPMRPFRRRTPLPYWLVLLTGLAIFLPGTAFVPQTPGAGASGSRTVVEQSENGGNRSGSRQAGVSSESQWTRLSPQEGVVVLNMLMTRQKDNYERMRTWTGAYQFRDRKHFDGERGTEFLREMKPGERTIKPPLWMTTTGVFRFAVDVESSSLYTSCEPDGPTVVTEKATGETVGHLSSAGCSEKTILTPEHYLHFSTNTNLGQVKGFSPVRLTPNNRRVAYRDASAKGRMLQWSTVMDPRLLFGTNRRPFFESFESDARSMSESLESTTRKEYPCREVYLRKGSDNDGTMYHVAHRYLFSETPGESHEQDVILRAKAGFNAVEASQGTGSQRRQKTTWEYRKIDGMLVPSSIRFEIVAVDESAFSFERVLTLEECNLNKPVNPASFTYKQFGLKNGERLFDRIENALFVYQDGEFVPIGRL